MEIIDSWRNLKDDELEEWFLNRLPEGKACFDQLLEVILYFAGKNQPDKAEACADLLQDALKKEKAEAELLLLLERRAEWQSDHEAYAASCFKILAEFFEGQNLRKIFLEACGLQSGVPAGEALRRLRVLCQLSPGKCCYEKTWGPGVMSELDEFDRKLVINFEGKPAHRLAFGYAAENVQPLDDDHLLALKLRDRQAFERYVKDNPAETVKAVLNQFGEMSLTQLRALMTGLIVSEKGWSPFWAAARDKLSADPLVSLPAGRNDPIKILSERKEFDDRWRDDFLALTDVERILAEVESLYGKYPSQSLNNDLKTAVTDRLKFVVRGMGMEQQGVIVQALLLADAANIAPEVLPDISIYGRPENILAVLDSIPVRMINPFLVYLEKNRLPVMDIIMPILPRLSVSALNEVVIHCRQGGKEEQLYETIRIILRENTASAGMISWLGRNLRLACEKKICRLENFARVAIEVLQKSAAAGKRKDLGQLLRNVFTDKDLLKEMFQAMDTGRRLEFSRRINSLAGLTVADKMAIAAKIILLFPDLAGAFGDPVVSFAGPKLTSYRAYREKHAQLAKIINEEIPRNSKEIGVARSYGDLRENYEYKAAKEMQGLLLRRKAELEQMLSEVSGSDFADCPREVAGQGTGVELKMPDESKKVYYILGEWDSDEKLGIISCRSRLAETLSGHRAGDVVEIPGENSPRSCKIEAIRELPPEIRGWIESSPQL